MSLRARALSVLLALGILLSQQAAMLHGISHFEGLARQLLASEPLADALRTDQADLDQFCVQCLAFAQVANAAPGEAVSIALPTTADSETRVPARLRRGTPSNLPFLARAPPTTA